MGFGLAWDHDRASRWTVVQKKLCFANAAEAGRLAVTRGTPVTRTLRVRSTGARNDVVELIATPVREGWRFTATVAEERLTLVAAPADIAKRLALPDTACVLKLDRVLRTAGGAPVEVRTAYCRISLVGGGFAPRLRSRRLQ